MISDLTVSIVNYNSANYLEACLDSIYANTAGIKLEIIVVDNASTDHGPSMVKGKFPQVVLIANSQNRYFTGGHNQALAASHGRYFLILNPDTLIPENTLHGLVHFLDEHPSVGAVTCRELDSQSNLVITGATFPSPIVEVLEWTGLRDRYFTGILKRYRMSEWDRTSLRQIDVSTGSFIMSRTALLKACRGFDEGIRLYFSEYDLCWKISQARYSIMYVPDVSYIHIGQRSSTQEPKEAIRKIYFQDMYRYYRQHFGWLQASLMMGIIQVGRRLERIAYYLSPHRWVRYAQRKLQSRQGT